MNTPKEPPSDQGGRARSAQFSRIVDKLRRGLPSLTSILWRRQGGWFLAFFLLLAAVYAAQSLSTSARAPARLVVYAFSTQEETLTHGILPAFESHWESQTGTDLAIEAIFGPSGTLAGQINLGAPADVAIFSHAQHVNLLKMGRLVKFDTQSQVVASSPIVIVTRPGNPYHLNSYADLAQPGLLIIHPDPKGSGAGQWALLAEYGSGLIEYGDRALARKQVEEIWGNVHLLAPSARGALTLFELGAGDVFITYEQDARLALARGVPLEILIPSGTILTQPVAVRVDDNLRPAERPLVESFLEFLRSEAGVSILQRYHWRLTEGQAQGYPTLIDPITVEDLGGWPQAYGDLVESLWESGIEPRLSLESGVTLLEGGD